MNSSPIYDQMIAGLTFPTPPSIRSNHCTAEACRIEGALNGAESMKQAILELARAVPKPTKQLQALIEQIEDITHE